MSRLALVTGGSGYFGSLLVAALRARGDRVRVLDLQDAHDRPGDVEFVQADIADARRVRESCDGVDVVFHNVAQVPLARDPALFEAVNVHGTANLLARRGGCGCRQGRLHLVLRRLRGPRAQPGDARHDRRSPVEAYGPRKVRG